MSDFLIHYIDNNATEYIPIFTKTKTKTKEILVDIDNTKINNDIQTTSINCFKNVLRIFMYLRGFQSIQ